MENSKKGEKKSVTVIPPQESKVMMQGEELIKQGIAAGASVETMEKLLAMRRELKAEYAKEQFDFAMANFQSVVPTIKKTKKGGQTNAGVVAYKFAPIESIIEQVKKALTENGFSYKFDTKTTEDGVSVTCIAKHKDGHSESSEMSVPLGTKTQVMSAPQVVAASITFAKRYSFCNVFGIVTGDDDVDGNIPPGTTPTVNKKLDAMFEKAKKNLTASKDLTVLSDFRKKIEGSEKYNPEQKAELLAIIDKNIAEANKK